MKTKIVGVILVVAALSVSGCTLFKRSNSTASAKTPTTPPPVSLVQPLTPVVPMQTAASAPVIRRQPRPQWVSVSVFNNLLDLRTSIPSNGASVLVTNKRSERIAIQIGDRLLGVPDENGALGVMILPPGESFAIQDPGFSQKTIIKAIVINEKDERLGYVGTQVIWPRGSGQEGTEVQWDIRGGTPAGVAPAGVDPMILLPLSSNRTQAAPILSPLPATP